jgi:hypothetical protein
MATRNDNGLPKAALGMSYKVRAGRAVHFPRAWGLFPSETCWAAANQIIIVTNDLERSSLDDEMHKVEVMSSGMLKGAPPPVKPSPSAAAYMRDKLRHAVGDPGMTPEEALADSAPRQAKKKSRKKTTSRISASAAAAASGAEPESVDRSPEGGSDE